MPFVINMKCIKYYITSRFVKELQGDYEFNEKLIIKMLN